MSSARIRVSDALLMRVASRLTERDRSILRLISDHRVFTTDQLTEMFFTNPTTARHRLTALYRLQLVDRFQPRRWVNDSAPYHYVLGGAGALVVAAERDQDLERCHWRSDRALALGRSQRLAHLVGVNGFFSALVAEARQRPHARLAEWWSESRCATAMAGLAYPDGLGIWEEDGVVVDFFLEYDRSTETLERLAAKLTGYEHLEDATAKPSRVLFCFRSGRREAGARRALAAATVPVATAAPTAGQRPHEAIWAPLGNDVDRLGLVELAGVAIPAGSRQRVHDATEYRRQQEEEHRERAARQAARGW